ncbi:MAG: hypothetical protein WBP09_00170, partial [Propionicimonas sp.]
RVDPIVGPSHYQEPAKYAPPSTKPGTVQFWAEEGTVYFLTALTQPWHAALFAPHLGYYSLIANAATLLATLVPLENAPVVTLVISFLAQLLPAMIVMASRSSVFSTPWIRLATCVALIFVPSAVGEIWLNVINTQAFFAVSGFLLLIEPDAPPRRTTALAMLLLFLGLSAPAVVFLLPLFVIRWLVTRHRSSWILCGTLIFTFLVQVVAHLAVASERTQASWHDWFTGWLTTNVAGAVLYRYPGPSALVAAGILLTLGLLVLGTHRSPMLLVSLSAFIWLSMLSSWFSLRGTSGPRYAYAPTIALVVALLAVVSRAIEPRAARLVAGLMVGAILAGGILTYFRPDPSISPAFPVWAEEVSRFRAGETDELLLWPQWEERSWSVRVPRA